jgi:hypothetical protein
LVAAALVQHQRVEFRLVHQVVILNLHLWLPLLVVAVVVQQVMVQALLAVLVVVVVDSVHRQQAELQHQDKVLQVVLHHLAVILLVQAAVAQVELVEMVLLQALVLATVALVAQELTPLQIGGHYLMHLLLRAQVLMVTLQVAVEAQTEIIHWH